MIRLAAVAAAAAAVAGAATAAPSGRLVVTYWAHGRDGAAVTWLLRCAPAGGTHPAAGRSCAEAAAHVAQLGPATSACKVLAPRGAAEARVVGRYGSRRVDRTYRIGCPGWKSLRVLLTGR